MPRTNQINNGQPPPEVDQLVLMELRIPEWMRIEINIRAMRLGIKRNDYVRAIFREALDMEKNK